MNTKSKVIGAAVGALSLCGLSTAAFAFPQTPPSALVGLDLATPLPEGVYFLDIASVGGLQLNGPAFNPYTYTYGTAYPFTTASSFNWNIPAIVWQTPWSLGGVHLSFLFALPEAEVGTYATQEYGMYSRSRYATGTYQYGLYTPYLQATFAYAFGNGMSLSYSPGVYIPMSGTAGFDPLFNQWSFNQMLAFAYHVNGWNLTANVQYNIVGNTQNGYLPYAGITVDQGCAATGLGLGFSSCQTLLTDTVSYNIGLTKTMGKWEVGIVGYGFSDTSSGLVNRLYGLHDVGSFPVYGGKQSAFALGGLVGYNFGPVITQLIIGSDVTGTNLPTRDTRGTLHVIIPLWNPETPKVVAAKY